MSGFNSLKLATARVLRDNPELRSVEMREKVWDKVRQIYPTCKCETITRMCRKLQNQMGLYTIIDHRNQLENNYKEYFVGGKE